MSLSDRPLIDLLILMFSATVCVVLLVITVGISVAGVMQPNSPGFPQYLIGLTSAASVLLGAALGMLAGRRVAPQPVKE